MVEIMNSGMAEIDALLDQADALKFGDYQAAIALSEKAAGLAQQAGDFRRYAQALTYQAWAYAMLGRLESALTTAHETLQLTRNEGLTAQEARIINVIASCYVQCGLMDEAVRLYEYQLELSERIGHLELQALALHDMGIVLISDTEDYERGLAFLRRAKAVMPWGIHRDVEHSIISSSLGLNYVKTGQFDAALEHAQEGFAIAERAQNANAVSNAYYTLARIYVSQGNAPAAQRYIDRVRSNTGHDARLMIDMAMLEADALIMEGRHAECAQKLENLYTQLLEGQHFNDARYALEIAKFCYEQLDDQMGVIRVYERLTHEIPHHQQQSSDLRLMVLALVFAQNKAQIREKIKLTQQKYELLHRLSHEFRTPLTVIQSSAEIVDGYGEKMPLERRQKHLRNIRGQVKSMTAMLENITALLQEPDDHEGDGHKANALETLVHAVFARLDEAGMESERIHFTPTASSSRLPATSIESIAYHLLHNALRYSTGTVNLEMFSDSSGLEVRVSDSGIGIPDAEQQAVFEPLVRGSNQNEPTGGGLGLAIVAKLVKQLHGTLELVSTLNVGTQVRVSIPSVNLPP